MKIFIVLKIAFLALMRNKMRTALTMLGLIIGVGAVIATVSLGDGAKSQVEAQIATLGQNVVLVFSGSWTRGGARGGWGAAGTLTLEDALSIQREVPDVVLLSQECRNSAQIAAGNENWYTTILGEAECYLQIRQWPLEDGTMFSAMDVRSAAKVAVIGKTVADKLFPGSNPVGQVIRVKNVPFLVMGVLIPKGLSVRGDDQDDVVLIPYTSSMKRLFGGTTLRSMIMEARTTKALATVQLQINNLLRQRHRIIPPADDDFTVRTQEEIAQMANGASDTIRSLLFAVACVSLLVGGIGIMNIMLVSVTERTREIGIRMAVGAHGSDILMQFLTEAVSLSILGGGLGIAMGVICSRIMANYKHWPVLTSPGWIAAAFSFSALVGIVFGFYPAFKASRLDPIDALRYE